MKFQIALAMFVSSHLLASESNDLRQLAAQYAQATAYDKAISLYLQLLPTDQSIRSELLQTYLIAEQYQAIVDFLKDDPQSDEERVFLGSAYNKMGHYGKALEILSSATPNPNIQHQRALAYYHLGRYEEARQQWALLPKGEMTHLYLARVDLAQGRPQEAIQRVQRIDGNEATYIRGQAYDQLGEYEKAIDAFKASLPKDDPEVAPWYRQITFQCALCHLKLYEGHSGSLKSGKELLNQAGRILNDLLDQQKDEETLLLLAKIYLTLGRDFDDQEAFAKVESILSDSTQFSTSSQDQALLLRAEAASTYNAKDRLYRHLTQDSKRGSSAYAKGWYLRGLNDFKEGERLHSQEERDSLFSHAITAFEKAFELLYPEDKKLALDALTYEIQAILYLRKIDKLTSAFEKLKICIDQKKFPNSDSLIYLQAVTALEAANWGETRFLPIAFEIIEKGIQEAGTLADSLTHLSGILSYRNGNYPQAKKTFLNLVSQFPQSSMAGEALFWAARCCDALKEKDEAKKYRLRVIDQYPHSDKAAEAYFSFYSFQEYLQGDRSAIKHLQSFPEKFPDSPYVISAWYLIGLDYKQERKTPEGKWIHKINPLAAIEAFQNAEEAFSQLTQNADRELYSSIFHHAILERALTNIDIAEVSQGAKRQICLEYAEELLKKMSGHDTPIAEEVSYWLALTNVKLNREEEAEQLLQSMLQHYESATITRGYFLSRVWYEKGEISFKQGHYPEALICYSKAEDAAKGKVLSSDQRLELWIRQSECYRNMHDYDHALLLLSKVINDDSISNLRVRAKYLRAEVYELQGRHELARRQLYAAEKEE